MGSWVEQAVHLGGKLCAAAVPVSPYSTLYAALVCGVDVPTGRDKALFVDTGLIHILVVSGAHLVFVERLCSWMPERARLLAVAVYCWLTDFGAPVVRALMRRLWAYGVRRWGWTSLQVEAAASASILAVHPQWIVSRSFLMSWLCALAMLAPIRLFRWEELNLSVKCYLFLFPFCLSSPLAIGWNALLGPLIGEILFPVCLSVFVLPFLVPFGDMVWLALLWLLETGPKASPVETWWPTIGIWWLPLGVHVLLLWGEWKWRRAVAFSS